MDSVSVSKIAEAEGLVHRYPHVYQISQLPIECLGIELESIGCFPVCPASLRFQFLWKVPVVYGKACLYAIAVESLAKKAVVGDSLFVHFPSTIWQDSGPGYGESVGLEAYLCH